ncbi:putative carboxymethylenebutenolidase [Syncephalis pseudoplumigaleata]|uniref:Putative carboxymethylenebutenolidase n=1 Tax=Syncephalis pseudoplumigaleata TaxID=1712513 RepID=A0A4P9Z3Q0_9FUNG|nr:putative carboxymethylenebutenolidase [Syncephalis pseudoplumigaleata]|eukprot:RKP27018.1 putative carboxymethylenebutenolidase [Syncephalis pseudoplumigaleata]
MDVQYNGNTAFLAKPSDASAAPPTHGVVVVQEWWGINDAMKSMARRFADAGLLALLPDLYHGRVAATSDEAQHLMTGLDWPAAVKEIHAAATYLRSQGCEKVVVTGFCMGGALTAASAVLNADVFTAAAPFYGIPPATLCNLEETKIPVQAHFGKLDNHKGFSDPATVREYEEKLKKSGVKYELHWYDADHAFMNETRPEVYEPASAKIAFERVVSFVKAQ